MGEHFFPATPGRGRIAYKARGIVPLAGEKPARGKALAAPFVRLENRWLIVEKGRIAGIGEKAPHSCHKVDLGDVIILPPLVNAHTHLQLSWLAGKTRWGLGFTEWLKSMLPLLLPVAGSAFGAREHEEALTEACQSLAMSTLYAGDVGGSLPGSLPAVAAAAEKQSLKLAHFCEWFGFAPATSIWPPRCKEDIARNDSLGRLCAPAAHGLYSTAASTISMAHAWCKRQDRVFSIHLAESEEETELLCSGTGSLAELYRGAVLPPHWQPPGLRPLQYAARLGILGPGTLAVHGVHLDRRETALLAASGAALCLCPRSNYNLGVGEARWNDLIASGTLLCLGTDGLTSNQDLDIRNEARFLRQLAEIPWRALWRMATVNGAAALGMPYAGLTPGQPGIFSIWPYETSDV